MMTFLGGHPTTRPASFLFRLSFGLFGFEPTLSLFNGFVFLGQISVHEWLLDMFIPVHDVIPYGVEADMR